MGKNSEWKTKVNLIPISIYLCNSKIFQYERFTDFWLMNIPHFPIVKKLLQPPSVNLVKAILNSRFTEQQCCKKTSEVIQSTFLIRTNALWNFQLTPPPHWHQEAQSSLLVLPSAALPTTTPTQCLLHLTEDNSPNVWRCCLVLPSLFLISGDDWRSCEKGELAFSQL